MHTYWEKKSVVNSERMIVDLSRPCLTISAHTLFNICRVGIRRAWAIRSKRIQFQFMHGKCQRSHSATRTHHAAATLPQTKYVHDTSYTVFVKRQDAPNRRQNRKKTKIIYGKVFCVVIVIVMLIANSDRLLYLVFEWNVPINAIYAVRFCMVQNFTSFLHFKYFAGSTVGECVPFSITCIDMNKFIVFGTRLWPDTATMNNDGISVVGVISVLRSRSQDAIEQYRNVFVSLSRLCASFSFPFKPICWHVLCQVDFEQD